MTDFDLAAVDLSGILNKTPEQKAKQLPDPKRFLFSVSSPMPLKSLKTVR
jgi:hypothetical protein